MTAPAIPHRILARLLSLLAVVMLVASPLAPSPAVAMPLDCCPNAPHHDVGKSLCPQACVTGCVVIPSPIENPAEPAHFETAPLEPAPAQRLVGRAIAPEPPPPR